MIDEKKAKGLDAKVGFVFGDDHYVARVKKGRIRVARGAVDGADVVFAGPPTLLAAVVYGGQPLDMIEVRGDRDLAKRFVTLFPLPSKVGFAGH